MFGEERVLEILETKLSSGKNYLDALVNAVQEFTNSSRDDSFEYTLISLERLPEETSLKPALQVDTRYMT